ncbi:MAG: hypothetical protein FJY17_06925 [Bacteroidetes bacterium]|nr:hypothetical protein [Bacteroidota bacterium]
MNIHCKTLFLGITFCTLLYGLTGCNPPTTNTESTAESNSKPEELPLSEENQSFQNDSPNSEKQVLEDSLMEAARIEAARIELKNLEATKDIERKKVELAIIREKERIRKAQQAEVAGPTNSVPLVNTPPKIEEPKAPVIEVSYSKSLDLKLQDKKLVWRAVGPGDYSISVTRAVDNAIVFNSSTGDTSISYSSLELDESIRYAVKVQYATKKLSEKKSFSLIARGTMLNPTCK